MKHAKDRLGQQLKVGHRIYIPAKIVNISPTPGQYDTKVILDETAGLRERTEVILNSSQVELHPDEDPADEIDETPAAPSGVQDSNVGTVDANAERLKAEQAAAQEKAAKEAEEERILNEEIAAEKAEQEAEAKLLAERKKEREAAEAEALARHENRLAEQAAADAEKKAAEEAAAADKNKQTDAASTEKKSEEKADDANPHKL